MENKFTLADFEKLWSDAQERDRQFREDTKKYWPDIGSFPEDLPEGVYQGSIGGVRGYYSIKMIAILREAARKEFEKHKNK